ncbi:MAG TPA: ABC transporter, partial [Arenimonas sp.]|nr:ABC transporter [Arenimonas sp.]
MTPAFSLAGISKRYPDFSLRDVSLTLPEGQVMGLVGVNGAG